MDSDEEHRARSNKLNESVLNWRPPNPSKRHPQMPTTFSEADEIERQLERDGHRTWGLVIYRCTSDSDWAELMRRLREDIDDALDFFNGLDLLDSLALTVFEDRATLDGASTSTIRDKFCQWAVSAPQEEQGKGRGMSPRYQFCIMVDDAALDSVIHSSNDQDAFVNIIIGRWEPYGPVDAEEEGEEPLEGCTLEDVGWLKAQFLHVMVSMYYYLTSEVAWSVQYQRPPAIVGK